MLGLAAGVLTLGIAAPFVGGLIGAAVGLHGAAAASAGLAAIGGGSLAAGGLGMVGGTAVLVGGGAIFGVGMGVGAASWTSGSSRSQLLLQCAKVEVFLREIVVGRHRRYTRAAEILEGLRQEQRDLETETAKRRGADDATTEEIREREKAAEGLQWVITRTESWCKKRASLEPE